MGLLLPATFFGGVGNMLVIVGFMVTAATAGGATAGAILHGVTVAIAVNAALVLLGVLLAALFLRTEQRKLANRRVGQPAERHALGNGGCGARTPGPCARPPQPGPPPEGSWDRSFLWSEGARHFYRIRS
ncbi:hypothetical protein [Microtetraspora malaysiensis]|uniref:hypothetical protein n=1 Tax=Microtetraspora malaysiensis TaxID=161358 RepID=UPI0008306F25|nr:hypothetical protein [Microtetraspora malaysiensis]